VSIVPMLIGVPVAATPGLGPHDDVPVDALALLVAALVVELLAAAAVLLVAAGALLELLLLLLLPHPAKNSRPRDASNAKLGRMRDPWW
jgi:hypothetical protein